MMIHRHVAPYREVTPFDKDMTDNYKEAAYEYHDTLVKTGGRPTRPVLEKPAGKAVYKKEEGIIDIIDEHGKLACTLEYDMSPIHYHWTQECSRFEGELDRWKEFQEYQQRNPQLSPLETAFDLRDTDQSLEAILLRLNEWREFEVYHQCKVNDAMMLTWRTRRVLDQLIQEEAASDPAESSPKIQRKLREWLDQLFPKQMDLEAKQKQLACIETQAFEILSEAIASLNGAPLLCQQLEKEMEKQTNVVYRELELLGARPSRTAQASSPTAPYSQRILHWKSETSRLLKERGEWKMFRKWRKNQANASTSVIADGHRSRGHRMDPALWLDYVTYLQSQLDKARGWVSCWRRLQRSTEKREQGLIEAGEPILGGSIESIQLYVDHFQQDVRTAEARLRSAQQQLAELSPQQAPAAAHENAQRSTKHQELPPSLPDSGAPGVRSHNEENPRSRFSPTKADRSPPAHEFSGSVHPSSIPSQVGDKRAKKDNTDNGQLFAVSDDLIPDPAKVDDDTQMTDARDHSYSYELIGDGNGANPIDTPMSDIEDPVTNSPPPVSKMSIKGRGSRAKRKSRLPVDQVPTSRKTRSATKLDQDTSDRVLKNTDKKSVRKKKGFSERQTMALLNTASTNGSSTRSSPSLRRSQRLKEKAAASKRKVCI